MNSAEIVSKVSKYENGGNKESLILVLVVCEDDLPVTSGDHQIEVCIRMHWDMQNKGFRSPPEFCLFPLAEW